MNTLRYDGHHRSIKCCCLLLILLKFSFISIFADEIHLKNKRKLEGLIYKVTQKAVSIYVITDNGQIHSAKIPRRDVKKLVKKRSRISKLIKRLKNLSPDAPTAYYQCGVWCVNNNWSYPAEKLLTYVAHADEHLRGRACAKLAKITSELETRYRLQQTAFFYAPEDEQLQADFYLLYEEFAKQMAVAQELLRNAVNKIANGAYRQAFLILHEAKEKSDTWKLLRGILQNHYRYNVSQLYSILANEMLGYGEPCPKCQGRKYTVCKKCKGTRRIKCVVCKGQRSFTKKIQSLKGLTKITKDCPLCRATGEIRCIWCKNSLSPGRDLCSGCRGTGVREIPIVKRQNPICPACKGKKKKMCSNCRGYGFKVCRMCRGRGGSADKYCNGCSGRGTIHCEKCNTGWMDCQKCQSQGRLYRVYGPKIQISELAREDFVNIQRALVERELSPTEQLQTPRKKIPPIATWLPANKEIVFYHGKWTSPQHKSLISKKKIAKNVSKLYAIQKRAFLLQDINWFVYLRKTNSDILAKTAQTYVTSFAMTETRTHPWFSVRNGIISMGLMGDSSKQLRLHIEVDNKIPLSKFKKKKPMQRYSQLELKLYYTLPQATWTYKTKKQVLFIRGKVRLQIIAAELLHKDKTFAYCIE